MIEKNFEKIILAVVVVIAIISLINIVITTSMSTTVLSKERVAKEQARPANIQITKILSSACEGCGILANELAKIKQDNVNVSNEVDMDVQSEQAKELISQHGIQKLPALIITGDVNKSSLAFTTLGRVTNNVFVYEKQAPPYYDYSSNKIYGEVKATAITDASCVECFNVTGYLNNLKKSIYISSIKNFDYKSQDGKAIIDKYNISSAPALVLSSDLGAYGTSTEQAVSSGVLGIRSGDYVFSQMPPPFRNLSSGEVKGRVILTNIVDNTCAQCYNVSLQKRILAGFGVYIQDEATYDVNSTDGRNLVAKYNITVVPTIILSPEAGVYESLAMVWKQVGTVNEGYYIFRNMSALGETYKDLVSGNIINQQQAQ